MRPDLDDVVEEQADLLGQREPWDQIIGPVRRREARVLERRHLLIMVEIAETGSVRGGQGLQLWSGHVVILS